MDDLDGSPGAETVRFGLDGTEYEIDLKGKHAKALRKAVGKFAAEGRPVRQKTAGRTMQTRERAVRVRMWARNNGYTVGTKGRIPAEMEDGVHRGAAEHAHADLTAGTQKTAATLSPEGGWWRRSSAIPGPGSAKAGK